MKHSIRTPLHFGVGTVFFFIILETITVPMVAISNKIIIENIFNAGVAGFFIAFIAIIMIVSIAKHYIISRSQDLFNRQLQSISGILYIGSLAGALLMLMFVLQSMFFKNGYNEFVTGFCSGFFSVLAVLLLHKFAIFIRLRLPTLTFNNGSTYFITLTYKEIITLALIFGVYELMACPITGIWVHQTSNRILIAIISGAIAGTTGGLFLYSLSNIFKVKLHMKLTLISA